MDESTSTEKSSDVVYQSLPAITDHDKELAQQALNEFEKGQNEACLNTLNKLLKLRQLDPKCLHNKSVVEYYQSGLRKTDEFQQEISALCQQCQVNLENVASMDDVDQCLLYYNHAVILYYIRQYHSALNIVDKLFQFIEPLEENFARKVTFLLIELYLCTQQPEQAHGMLSFVEKGMFNNGNKSQAPTPEKEQSKDSKDSTPEQQPNDIWRPKISQYKARCYLMLKSMKPCKREIKNLMNSVGVTPQLIYLKSNFEYLRGNYRKAIKVLNTAPQNKGNMENPEALTVMYYNNLGCIHFHMRKHNLGCFYLKKAFQENESISKDIKKVDITKTLSGKPVSQLGISRHYELLYNIGIQLLHASKPLAAFDCLIEVVQIFSANPRLWLRLAECCILVYRESNEDDSKLINRLQVIKGSVGSGVHRKLLIGTGLNSNIKTSSESPAIPTTTLEFAALCLRNALMLLPEENAGLEEEDSNDGSKLGYDITSVPAPPGNPMRGQEVANLRCSVLCDSAYVSLCLNDFLMAMIYSERLLKIPKISGAHRYLGHMYMAEALMFMEKISDAIQHLNPDNILDISPVPPEYKIDHEKSEKNGEPMEGNDLKAQSNWLPRDLPKARAIMQYNLAVTHTLRGEHEKAMMNLAKSTQGIGTPFPAHIYFLRLYLDLMEGRRKLAQGVIKEHFGNMTPNRV